MQKVQRYRGFVLTDTGLQKLKKHIQTLESQTWIRQNARTIAERVQLTHADGIHPITVRKILRGQDGVDRRSIQRVFEALELDLQEGDCAHANLYQEPDDAGLQSAPLAQSSPVASDATKLSQVKHHLPSAIAHQAATLSEIDRISDRRFQGRTQELAHLRHLILDERCRLLTVLGMGGIGKTALVAHFTKTMQDQFEQVLWRSLRPAPSLDELLRSLLRSLASSSGSGADLPSYTEALMTRLLDTLRQSRCLLVLEQMETVLCDRGLAGYWRNDCRAYGELVRRLAEVPHQSSIIITSREKPRDIAVLESRAVRSVQLEGLSVAECQQLLSDRVRLRGTEAEWQALVHHYGGNPLALKLVAERIWDYFNGSLSAGLEEVQRGYFILSDLQDLVSQQVSRLSTPERELLDQFITHEPWTPLAQLKHDVAMLPWQRYLFDVLDSLQRRSLIQRQSTSFRLQPFLMDYLPDALPYSHSDPSDFTLSEVCVNSLCTGQKL